MMPSVKLVPNKDGTYDLWLEYPRGDTEFANEFHSGPDGKTNPRKLSKIISGYAKKVKIKSVKILVAGTLITTVALSSFLTALAATDRYTMGYLYSGNDLQQIEYVNQTNNALDVVSPSYFDIREDGSLKLNYLSPFFIKTMHDQGVRVVPFLSNHWNRTAGINALKHVESLSTQIADYVEEYDLDGVNVDIENVTHEQRDQYTELVRLLREKIPSHKEVSVAVAANPNNWQVGWHGSYDYTALAQYADHLMIMGYDEHYEGGEAGPVASIDFVEKSIQYALSKTTPDKIVIGVPFYGRVWSLDNNRIVGKGTSSKTIQQILESCASTVTYDEKSKSVKAEFTITEGDGTFTVGSNVILEPGNYVVWFENDQSYQAKLSLIEKYNLKGAGAWSLGQEDSSIWEHYEGWINGDNSNTEPADPSTPPAPEQPVPPEEEESAPEPPKNEGVLPEPPTTEHFIYEVKSGDSLWKIAQEHLGRGNRYTEIMELNGLSSDRIYPGMKLKLPGASGGGNVEIVSREYTVKRGDSLWKIAQSHLGSGSRYTEIMELNGLTSNTIHPGQVLKLPNQ